MADRKAKAGAYKGGAKPPATTPAVEASAALPEIAAPEAATVPFIVEAAPEPPLEAFTADISAAALATVEPAEIHVTLTKETETMNTQTFQNDTIETARQAQTVATERMQAAMGDMSERTRTAFEKSTRLMDEMNDFTKGNVEAFVASGRAAARGMESLGQEVAEFGRRSFEEASTTVKNFAEVKSPTDFIRLQSDYARSAFDAFVAESSRMGERMIKLTGEVMEPLSNRYSAAADRVKNAAL